MYTFLERLQIAHYERKKESLTSSVKYKKTPVQIILTVLMYISLIAAALIVMLPMYVILTSSFKNNSEITGSNPLLFPAELRWSNYFGISYDASGVPHPSAWNFQSLSSYNPTTLGQAFLWTILIAAVSIVFTVMSGAFVSYVLSRFDFKGKKVVRALFLIASIIPSVTMQVSVFGLISKMGLTSAAAQPFALILLYGGTDIISIYIFIQFLDGIPKDLDEAGLVDGCNYWKIFWRIVFPLMKPAIACVVIIKGIAYYNDFYLPSLYMPDHYTVSTFLQKMNGATNTDWGVVCAGVVMAIVPTIIVFVFLQKQIYSGMTSGAVK